MISNSRNRFIKVWEKFCKFYKKYGTYKYGMQKLWGPHFREERDIVFHLARFCFEEFSLGYVHLDSPVSRYYFYNFPAKVAGKRVRTKFIDIDISDPRTFTTRNTPRDIFAEVKWIYKDMHKPRRDRVRAQVRKIENDCYKLRDHLNNNRCKHAFVCIIDEEPDFSKINQQVLGNWQQIYSPVEVLYYKPP